MAETISMPKLGFDMAEGTLVRWVIAEGQEVKKGEALAEIETDKATVEVEANVSGILFKHLVEEGSVVPVGMPIAVVAAPGEEVKDIPTVVEGEAEVEKKLPTEPEKAGEQTPTSVAMPAAEPGRLKASPVAKRLAEELNLNLAAVSGTGPGGRIIKKDVEAASTSTLTPGVVQTPASSIQEGKPVFAPVIWTPGAELPADERVPLTKLRTIIGKRMVESKTTVPHFTVTGNINAAPVMKLRKEVNLQLPEEQKISVNDFIVKAAAIVLRQFPNINASFNGNEIIRHGHVNVGVAVAIESGLLTVVNKDTDIKPIRLISKEMKEMVARARSGKVRTEDIEGSTFSISNLGMFGVEYFTAIINPPEAAILAVGAVEELPVVENGEIKPGMRMKATISADHRVTDGAEAARFMQALTEILENPLRLLL